LLSVLRSPLLPLRHRGPALNLLHRLWYPLLEKAGLRRRRFHDLRHTYASLLLAGKESPVYVEDQLGHSSIKVTVDLYGHLVPGANRSAVDRLAAAPAATFLKPTRRIASRRSAEVAKKTGAGGPLWIVDATADVRISSDLLTEFCRP
jgi:hypothetical protein